MTPATTIPRFLQIHTLHSYPPALLNRDDSGAAKRIRFGNANRIRISSQCLKSHWRKAFAGYGLDQAVGPNSTRSRYALEAFVVDPLTTAGIPVDCARAAAQALLDEITGSSAEKKGKGKAEVKSDQVFALGHGEVTILLGIARAACETSKKPEEVAQAAKDLLTPERRKELQIRKNVGADTWCFGRMMLGDVLLGYDGAVHVSHALGVAAESTENDYFTAIDDLATEVDVAASGHLGTTELAANIFYGHVAIDLPLLVANATGCPTKEWATQDLASIRKVIDAIIYAIVTVSPGAKKGSTAPYAYASLTLAELGWSQPRTLANAFISAIPRKAENPLLEAGTRLAAEALATDSFLGVDSINRRALCDKALQPLVTNGGPLVTINASSLPGLAKWVQDSLTAPIAKAG